MKTCIYILAVLFSVAVGCKKDGNGGGGPSNKTVSTQDRSFVMKASMGNYAEIQAGQLAVTHSTNTAIQNFASQMVTDHSAAQAQLHTIAMNLSIYAPDSLDSAHVALQNLLMILTGAAFDSVYINSQVLDHAKAIALYSAEVTIGTNSQVKTYALTKLPVIQMHKQEADSLANLYGH